MSPLQKKRYLRVMVSDKFEGIGGNWFPLYIPVYVEDGNLPNFSQIITLDQKPTLLTEEEFAVVSKPDLV